jgi:hypothetical protein
MIESKLGAIFVHLALFTCTNTELGCQEAKTTHTIVWYDTLSWTSPDRFDPSDC